MARFLKIPILTSVLSKTKQTPAQVTLEKEKRQTNIKGAFLCQEPNAIKNKTVFLLDDVLTTGSTMEECARVLKNSGAKKVWGIVVARG